MILARLLTPDDFGLVAIVAAYLMILSDVGGLGLAQALIQADRISHRQVSCLFWINVGVSVATAVLFVSVSPILASVYDEPQLQPVAASLAVLLVLTGASAQHFALLTRRMRFRQIPLCQ